MTFIDFCRAHGLLVDSVAEGRWVRVPTADHPRKKNGAYKFMGDIGWCQNHAQSPEVSTWRIDADAPSVDTQRIANQAAAFDQKMREGWDRAAQRAQQLISAAKQTDHPYLHYKGLPKARGLVLDDGALLVPMRHWRTNELQGAQIIRWMPDEMRYDKKMLPGMRAKGAVLRLGAPQAARCWLVEGLATGLSVDAALRLLNLRDSVVVCFSAGNLMQVAPLLGGERLVFADNDESGAGERAAVATGLRFCMSLDRGDANDLHKSQGVFAVAALITKTLTERETVP